MRKSKSTLLFILTSVLMIMMASCGQNHHSSPEACAQAAIDCYIASDYDGIIDLCHPDDSSTRKKFEQKRELANKGLLASHDDIKLSFNKIYDTYGLSTNKTVVYSDGDGRDYTLMVKEIDGKWYVDGFENF